MTDEVFDLDALETEGKPFPFKHGGEDYELPATVPLKFAMAQQEGRLAGMLEALLGHDQWTRLMASDAVFDDRKFEALMTAWNKHLGVAPGESRASRRSSGSTAGPSKRTSSTTTALR